MKISHLLQGGIVLLSCLLVACQSAPKPKGFELMRQDTTFLSGKRPFQLTRLIRGFKNAEEIDSTTRLDAEIWKIEAEEYPEQIRLYVRVFDTAGYIITRMAPPYREQRSAFWGELQERIGSDTVGNIPYQVREVGEQDSIPYAIVVAMDHGGSMAGVIHTVQNAAEKFLQLKRPYDLMAVVKFDNKVVVEVPLSQQKNLILARYKKHGLTGFGFYTALYDAMMESMRLLAQVPDSYIRILVLFADGYDNASKISDAEVIRYAQQQKIRIFPIGFGYTNDRFLANVAEYTGGKYYKAYSQKELEAIFYDIYGGLRNYYVLTYKPPKYSGRHYVRLHLQYWDNVAVAEGEYDKTPLSPFDTIGTRFVTEKIYFDFAKATLRPESYPIIDALAEFLIRNPNVKIEIQGHTDNIGGIEFNQKLSEERAKVVAEALIQRGVSPAQLRWRGFGMSRPVAPNDTEENRQKNRRTEFVIIAR